MVEDEQGGLHLRYRPKKSIPQAIGEAFYNSCVSLESELEEEVEVNEFMKQSLWRDRHRG
jgi:hypothetical protein